MYTISNWKIHGMKEKKTMGNVTGDKFLIDFLYLQVISKVHYTGENLRKE